MSENQDDKDVVSEPQDTQDADVAKLLEKNQRLQGQLADVEKKYRTFSSPI